MVNLEAMRPFTSFLLIVVMNLRPSRALNITDSIQILAATNSSSVCEKAAKRICFECSPDYAELTEAYQMVREVWTDNNDCGFDSSEQIISQFFSISSSIWKDGHCDDCFERRLNESGPYVISRPTFAFVNLSSEFVACVNNSDPDSNPCAECQEKYMQLGRSFQEKIFDQKSVCSDLISVINYVNYLWIQKHDCGSVFSPNWLVVALTGGNLLVIIIFYILLRVTQPPHSSRAFLTENRFSFSVNHRGRGDQGLLKNGANA